MSISEMLKQSAILTALGMAIVFAFLAFMIVCVNLVGKLVTTLAGVPPVAVELEGYLTAVAAPLSPRRLS
jgi:Na+-transporting methylmalonyl-CoA/oxaloacetate decarboxylase gamma subunit